MTTPIELPCICHVPPQLAKRLKLCVDTISGYSRFSPGQDGYQALKELKEFVESIQSKDEYIYPTPVEACRMIADNGGPIECESEDAGMKALLTHVAISHTDYPFRIDWTEHGYSCYRWVEKIRVYKPNP